MLRPSHARSCSVAGIAAALGVALFALGPGASGCSTDPRLVKTAFEPTAPPRDGGMLEPPRRDAETLPRAGGPASPTRDAQPSGPEAGAERCPESLSERLTTTTIQLDEEIRYKQRGYDEAPRDERVALSIAPDGSGQLAWLNQAGTHVHVTPLGSELTRRGDDVVLEGLEVGGLAARNDGFALLTRRDDPGEPLRDPAAMDRVAPAALLLQVRGGAELEPRALTGTLAVTRGAFPDARECAPTPLHGRLIWSGAMYGAYFKLHGCEGDPHASLYGDKLVYLDDTGEALPGGSGWICSISQGVRLVAESAAFTALCLSDSMPARGLHLAVEGEPVRTLAPEIGHSGYSGGQFGSIVKLRDGSYVVGWLSRGVTAPASNEPARAAADIAFLRLGDDHAPIGAPRSLRETPDIAEANLHLAVYGAGVLVVWDRVEELRCGEWTCWGRYTGTRARHVTPDGSPLSDEVSIAAAPNTEDDIAVFPNGDLAWAYVEEDARNYDRPLALEAGRPSVPAKRSLSIARLRACNL
jgi:hypothetical protein